MKIQEASWKYRKHLDIFNTPTNDLRIEQLISFSHHKLQRLDLVYYDPEISINKRGIGINFDYDVVAVQTLFLQEFQL